MKINNKIFKENLKNLIGEEIIIDENIVVESNLMDVNELDEGVTNSLIERGIKGNVMTHVAMSEDDKLYALIEQENEVKAAINITDGYKMYFN